MLANSEGKQQTFEMSIANFLKWLCNWQNGHLSIYALKIKTQEWLC
jgi:hypothetical protein